MSRRSWEQRVGDILDAIAEIRSFVADVSFEESVASAEKQKAVLADFTIIGEAARHIPPQIQSIYPEIEWRSKRDMRNIIVHVCFAVNARIVWNTIHDDLPMLEQQLLNLLKRERDAE